MAEMQSSPTDSILNNLHQSSNPRANSESYLYWYPTGIAVPDSRARLAVVDQQRLTHVET